MENTAIEILQILRGSKHYRQESYSIRLLYKEPELGDVFNRYYFLG